MGSAEGAVLLTMHHAQCAWQAGLQQNLPHMLWVASAKHLPHNHKLLLLLTSHADVAPGAKAQCIELSAA